MSGNAKDRRKARRRYERLQRFLEELCEQINENLLPAALYPEQLYSQNFWKDDRRQQETDFGRRWRQRWVPGRRHDEKKWP